MLEQLWRRSFLINKLYTKGSIVEVHLEMMVKVALRRAGQGQNFSIELGRRCEVEVEGQKGVVVRRMGACESVKLRASQTDEQRQGTCALIMQ